MKEHNEDKTFKFTYKSSPLYSDRIDEKSDPRNSESSDENKGIKKTKWDDVIEGGNDITEKYNDEINLDEEEKIDFKERHQNIIQHDPKKHVKGIAEKANELKLGIFKVIKSLDKIKFWENKGKNKEREIGIEEKELNEKEPITDKDFSKGEETFKNKKRFQHDEINKLKRSSGQGIDLDNMDFVDTTIDEVDTDKRVLDDTAITEIDADEKFINDMAIATDEIDSDKIFMEEYEEQQQSIDPYQARRERREQLRKKRKRQIIRQIAGIVLLIVVLTVSVVWFISVKENKGPAHALKITGAVDGDGSLHFVDVLNKGKDIVFERGYIWGQQTASRKYIILLDDQGGLYVTDKKGKNKTQIDENVQGVTGVQNDGVLYYKTREGANDYIRYTFKDKKIFEIGIGQIKLARQTMSLLYESGNKVYIVKADEEEKIELGTYMAGENIYLINISDSGDESTWVVNERENAAAYYTADGQVDTITTGYNPGLAASGYQMIFTQNKGEFVFYNTSDDQIFVKQKEQELKKLKFDREGMEVIYTKPSYISAVSQVELDNLFVLVGKKEGEEDVYGNLYYFNDELERQQILEDIEEVCGVREDIIYYIDKDYNLYSAQFKKDELQNKQLIWQNVDGAFVPIDDKQVYYVVDYNSSKKTGNLYYEAYGKEKELLSTDMRLYSGQFAEGGKGVLYYKDIQKMNNSDKLYGNLYLHVPGKEPKLIAENVENIAAAAENGFKLNSFLFYTFRQENENGYFADYVYYNGKESNTLIEKVQR